ncbi:FAD-dependent pyridine nucleotide-disulfide oxidoreductase [Sulfuricurvum kujiense DSM 16994]|uniref:FAD-dependent pyridine nucleotide-disulfide oxidoreductase n=1 Tax=Sulfuricurvum kujiense (strain ATCC BAA-921 / DSM 16994 / JCM 11577 / YK-1) TaxID=709032 RepID=E4U324_SULKY|nr:FAD-dependent oxidoreductase [Sulfuricurvum kujiense]ADR33694.1 FAD-dependent pyridine nucleotide-disulfide oxidoreductase [Sulfuricurvum kujiense DSM 16994]
MNISRRDLFKFAGLSVAAAAVTGCSTTAFDPLPKGSSQGTSSKMLGKHQVVIIGGGFGGLTVAKELKKIDPSFDVAIIEKNDSFMSCPFSNCNLGGIKGVSLSTLTHDYSQAIENNGYGMLTAVVTGIDREKKVVYTSKGGVGYDILVLAPGIDYNYKGQFPTWSDAKIAKAKRVAPAALMPGGEHVALDRMVKNMEDGDVVITVPAGKYRCPPAPFERASMIANYMKTEGFKGKVIILNETAEVAKGAAFKETWKDLYAGIVDHQDNCKIVDVDFDKKEITYVQTVFANKEDTEGVKTTKTLKYGIFNFIPHNMSSPVIEMSGVATTPDGFKKVKMATSPEKPVSFQTATDANVFAVGDVVGHAIPPSGQSAIWSGKECAKEIAHKLHGKSYSVASALPYKSANVCYSMVNGNPEEAIMVNHEFMVQGPVIGSKGSVPKGDEANNKFRSTGLGKATRDWYKGAMRDLFN